LKTRLFRHPLSYVVYSAAFDALPRAAREAAYARLTAVLRGQEPGEAFAELDPTDGAAILEILAETKPEFAAFLRH
jgi:hypothetical protein